VRHCQGASRKPQVTYGRDESIERRSENLGSISHQWAFELAQPQALAVVAQRSPLGP
jgi:hypothetical protein